MPFFPQSLQSCNTGPGATLILGEIVRKFKIRNIKRVTVFSLHAWRFSGCLEKIRFFLPVGKRGENVNR